MFLKKPRLMLVQKVLEWLAQKSRRSGKTNPLQIAVSVFFLLCAAVRKVHCWKKSLLEDSAIITHFWRVYDGPVQAINT